MFPSHVGHKDLPGGEDAVAVSARVPRDGGLLGLCGAVGFLKGRRRRLLVPPVLTVDIPSVPVVVSNARAVVIAVGVGGFGAEGQVDAQVGRSLDVLQGPVDGLRGSHRDRQVRHIDIADDGGLFHFSLCFDHVGAVTCKTTTNVMGLIRYNLMIVLC